MRALIVADIEQGKVDASIKKMLTAAAELAMPVDLLLASDDLQAPKQQVQNLGLLEHVLLAQDQALAGQLAEPMTHLVLSIAKDYTHILVNASTTGKNWLPRLAAKLDVEPLSEVIAIKSADTFVHSFYAGNAIATVKVHSAKKLLVVRSTSFAASQVSSTPKLCELELDLPTPLTKIVSQQSSDSERPDLSAASIVISGGRGMQNADNFNLLESLADQLGAAVGA